MYLSSAWARVAALMGALASLLSSRPALVLSGVYIRRSALAEFGTLAS
jgi:hypothetical protein